MIRVSFVVPVYNVAPYVEQCLSSILVQTVRNIEVLIVDDGSTDGAGAICDEVAHRDVRVSVVHTSNRGVSHARNSGLEKATGEFVCFVDSDDWLSPVFAERMLSFAEENDAPVVACGPTRVDSEGRVLWRRPCRHLVLNTEDALCGILRRDLYCGWPWNKLFRRSFLTQHHVRFDELLKWNEDIVFCFDAVRHAGRVVYDSSDDIYFYRENPTSVNQLMHARGVFDLQYLIRLKADDIILGWARGISRKVLRYAKANAFISNENILRRFFLLGAPDRAVVRLIARNMLRGFPFVLTCRGFGRLRTKCRYLWETTRALSGRIPMQKSEP
mgnify:CR=1 FL=1